MRSTKLVLTTAAVLSMATALASAQTTINGTLLGDQYSYWSVSDGGTRDRAAVFAFEQAPIPAPQFPLDYHDGTMVLKFDVDIPAPLVGETLNVVSAKIEVYNRKDAEWNPASGQVRLFAAGFGATSETDWTETSPYVGPTAFAPGTRAPFPRDLVTNTNAANSASATAWALGTVNPAEYTGVPANDPDEAFKVTFNLDVNNSTIESELLADLSAGVSSWVIGSTYAAAQPPTVTFYPEIVTKEGLANTAYGTAQQAPALIIEVEAVLTSVQNWEVFQ